MPLVPRAGYTAKLEAEVAKYCCVAVVASTPFSVGSYSARTAAQSRFRSTLRSHAIQPPPQRSRVDGPRRRLGLRAAAVENGADAVYFGLQGGFNARRRAANFSPAELPELMTFLRTRGVKGYLTLNTLVFGDELEEAERVPAWPSRPASMPCWFKTSGCCGCWAGFAPSCPCTPRPK